MGRPTIWLSNIGEDIEKIGGEELQSQMDKRPLVPWEISIFMWGTDDPGILRVEMLVK